MHQPTTATPLDLPELEPGLTLLERPSTRSPALHRLVVDELAASEGQTLWIDAGRDASSYGLYEHAPADRQLEGLTLARAFTAYQHATLVERVVRRATSRTALVVVPCTGALYRDDDVHEEVSTDLLTASLVHLRELAGALEIPVIVTTPGTTSTASLLADHADHTIASRQTDAGLRFEGDGYETTVYWQDGAWQTTIPYWVELFGCVCDGEPASVAGPAPPTIEG